MQQSPTQIHNVLSGKPKKALSFQVSNWKKSIEKEVQEHGIQLTSIEPKSEGLLARLLAPPSFHIHINILLEPNIWLIRQPHHQIWWIGPKKPTTIETEWRASLSVSVSASTK